MNRPVLCVTLMTVVIIAHWSDRLSDVRAAATDVCITMLFIAALAFTERKSA